jgi:hypothetical protein
MTQGASVSKSMKGQNWLFTVSNRRKRRGSVSRLLSSQEHAIAFHSPTCGPDTHLVAGGHHGMRGPRNPRYRARARKLTAHQESAIRVLAGTRRLRSLAADFGVSNEAIRAVLRRVRPASGRAL